MSVVKTKRKVFVKLGHLTEAKGVYVCVSGGYCWKSIVGSRQQFLKHLSTNSVFLSCLLDPINSAPKSSSGKYLPMVGFRWQRQSVFWRISGSGEQMLWSRVGHELDLEQDGARTGGIGRSCWAVNTTPSSLQQQEWCPAVHHPTPVQMLTHWKPLSQEMSCWQC